MRAPGRRGTLYYEFQYLVNRMVPLKLGKFSNLPHDADAEDDSEAENGEET